MVQNVWHRLLPGLLEDYDAPTSLPCIASRPLFVVNGRDDPRCARSSMYSSDVGAALVNDRRLEYSSMTVRSSKGGYSAT